MRKQFVCFLVCAILLETTVCPKRVDKSSKYISSDTTGETSDDTREQEVGIPIKARAGSGDCVELSSTEESGCPVGPTSTVRTTSRVTPWDVKIPNSMNLPRGPFFDFLLNICNALMSVKFSRILVGRYFEVLSKSLDGLGTDYIQKRWIKKFSKTLKAISGYNKHTQKKRVYDFLVFIMEGQPEKNEYFKAMNAIYKIKQDLKMDEYVYDLKNFGKRRTPHIGQKTRDVFEHIIFGTFKQQPEEVQSQIEYRFKTAVLEYWEERLNITSTNSTTQAP